MWLLSAGLPVFLPEWVLGFGARTGSLPPEEPLEDCEIAEVDVVLGRVVVIKPIGALHRGQGYAWPSVAEAGKESWPEVA